MEVKSKMVTLKAGDTKRQFEVSHAERLLRVRNNGGWVLPNDSGYEFNLKDGLTIKSDKGAFKKPD